MESFRGEFLFLRLELPSQENTKRQRDEHGKYQRNEPSRESCYRKISFPQGRLNHEVSCDACENILGNAKVSIFNHMNPKNAYQ